MAYSKIILNGETLMDVTGDTVDSENLLSGETATKNSGAKVTGSYTPPAETDPIFSASAASGITSNDISNWNSKTSNTGTVTSVRVQATSPVQSSTSTAQTATLNTTISLADGYGDTKNPYASKTKNYVLAAPSSQNGTPSFRALAAADIPDLSSSYLPASTTIPTITNTYSGTSSNGMSGVAVKSAIDALDGSISGTAGSGKTLTAFSQTDGKVSATFGNISITKSQVSDFPTIPTKVSDLTNDSGYITGYTETDPTVPSWAKASSKPSYTASEVGAVPTTRTVNGKALSSDITLSASDVSALPSSTTIPTITDTYSGTSSNGMSGKAVKSAIDALDGTVTGTAGSGKTLTAFSQTDGKVTATFGDISITKSQISDFPTIPTVNNATLTIQKNGTNVNTFTANASSNVTANITVPTKTSDLTNDSGFITSVTSTSTPTANVITKYDNNANLISSDMSAQEISDFIASL